MSASVNNCEAIKAITTATLKVMTSGWLIDRSRGMFSPLEPGCWA